MADPNKLRELYQKKYGAPAPKAPAAPKPATTATAFPRTLPLTEEEKRKAEQLTGELAVNVEVPKQKMERELLKTEIKADIAKNQPGLSNEEYERLAEESASMFGQPAVGGGFEGPTRPYAFVTPSATPVNVPMTAQRELGLFDVLGPQTKVPQQEAVQYIQPFNDMKFERSLTNLPKEEVAKQRVEYKASKAAFEKLKQQRPELNNFQLIQMLDDELNKIPEMVKVGGEKPVEGLAGALQPRMGATSVPVFSDVQLSYLDAKKSEVDPLEEQKLREKFANELVTETTFIRGAPVAKSRKLTETEIQSRIDDARAAEVPWYQDPAKLKEYTEKGVPVKSYGVFGETQFETGATAEGILTYPIRVITAPLNAIAGALGYAFTPEDIQLKKEAGREAKFKGTGVGANVLANIGTGGGYATEVGEAFKYSNTPWMNENPWIGYAAGTVLDIAGTADIGLIKGAVGGLKTGAAATVVSAKTGGGVAKTAVEAAKFGSKAAAAGALSELPLIGNRAAKIVEPGSVQLYFGQKLANDLASAGEYKRLVTGGISHDDAVADVIQKFGQSKFTDDATRIGKSIQSELNPGLDNFRFKGLDKTFFDYENFLDAVDGAVAGRKLSAAEESLLKPYVSFAVKADPKTASAVKKIVSDTILTGGETVPRGGKVVPSVLLKDSKVASSVKSAAAFDASVNSVDDIVQNVFGVGAKGGNFVMVTPRTIASAAAKDEILKSYESSELFKNVVSKFKTIETQVGADGKLQSGYKFIAPDPARQPEFDAAKKAVSDSVAKAYSRGDVSADEARLILSNIDNNFVSQTDLKLLTYSEVDDIAQASRQGITSKQLSAAKRLEPSEKTVISPTVRKQVAQDKRFEELKQEIPVVVSRMINFATSGTDTLKAALNPTQLRIIEQAKMKVNALNKQFRLDYQRIVADPEVARSYGVLPTDSRPLIFMSLGIGEAATKESRMAWTRQFVESLIYSTDNNSLYSAFFPGYRYGIAALNDSIRLDTLLGSLDYSSNQALFKQLPDVFDKVKQIVDADINVSLTSIGAKAVTVPKSLQEEALIAAYIRRKTAQITAESITDAFQAKQIRLPGDFGAIFKIARIPEAGYYKIVQYEITNPGFLKSVANGKLPKADAQLAFQKIFGDLARPEVSSAFSDVFAVRDDRFDFVNAVEETIDIIGDSGIAVSNRMEVALQSLKMLMDGKVNIDAFVAPTLVARIQEEIGSTPKFQNALKELAKLSDEAAGGNKLALTASKFVRDALESYNNFYYFAVLSLNPRFHGVNNLTAPLLTYYTTGRTGIFSRNAVGNYKEAVNTMLLGAPKANIAMSNKVVVTDALGNQYTRADIYNILQNSGAFKSQLSAEVPVGFIEDMKDIDKRFNIFNPKDWWRQASPKSGIPQPPPIWSQVLGDPMATYTDNVHRTVMFIDSLQRGETVEQAVEIARKSLFDYGAIGETERAATRNLFIFYNFWRQSVGQFVKNFFQDPARNIKLMKLSMGTSKMMMGDRPYENASDLSFYYPPEFGATRTVLNFQAAKNYKEGKAILTPTMPYSDALNVLTMALVNPKALLIGAEKPAGEGRAYEEGLIYSKLGPVWKTIGTLVMTKFGMIEDVKLSKNQIPPEHIAMWDAIGLGDYAIALFGAEAVDAQPGQNSYNGKIYKVSNEDFNAYRSYIAILQQTGGSRPYTDWGRLVGGFPLVYGGEPGLKGAFPETLPEYIGQTTGAITVTGGARPTDIQKKVLEQQTKEMQEQRKKLQESRKIPVPKQKL